MPGACSERSSSDPSDAPDLELERRFVEICLIAAYGCQTRGEIRQVTLVVAHERQQESGRLRQMPVHQFFCLVLCLLVTQRAAQCQAQQRGDADGAQQAPAQ
jgi:hypothetical protein